MSNVRRHRDTLRATLAPDCFRSYTNRVAITYDPAKRAEALEKRGLDFEAGFDVLANIQVFVVIETHVANEEGDRKSVV